MQEQNLTDYEGISEVPLKTKAKKQRKSRRYCTQDKSETEYSSIKTHNQNMKVITLPDFVHK